MRIGVYGGSFDPPHNGHLELCLLAHKRLGLDRLIISVSKNPFKSSFDASDLHRKAMVELLVAEVNQIGDFAVVSDWELERPGPSYTIDLLRYLQHEFGNAELMLLVGEDSYREMPDWKASNEIQELCRIAVFMRRSASVIYLKTAALPPALLVDFDQPASATDVRKLLKNGQSASHLLPSSIAAYIRINGLYH